MICHLMHPTMTVYHLKQLQRRAKENIKKAHQRQLRNYNKNQQDMSFKERERIWMINFSQSSAKDCFTATFALKWKGPYRVIPQMGPVNYKIALESTGEDGRVVHVCNLKPCFPTASELEAQEKRKLIDLKESSDDEEFLGF